MSDVELRDCPFCGGEAKLYGGRPDNYAWIRCTKCHATLDSRIGEKHAADTWNTRTPADRDALADAIIRDAHDAINELELRYDDGESWDTGDALLSANLAHIMDCARALRGEEESTRGRIEEEE